MGNSLKRTANPHIGRLPKNKRGRDFVIGDIHGCLEGVYNLLERVKFDKSKDRLICTGDLTHRGPDSLGCLDLLNNPWFHTVRGNHEENTIDALNLHFGMPTTKADAFYQLAKDGGLWLCELVAKTFSKSPKAHLVSQALAEALHNLQSLPKIIIVGDEKQKVPEFVVVHSFLLKSDKFNPEHDKFYEECIWTLEELDGISEGKIPLQQPKLLNESKHVGAFLKRQEAENKTPKLSKKDLEMLRENQIPPIFCGHTPLREPTEFLGHVHLDTGAGKPNKEHFVRKLTMINTQSYQVYQVNAGFAEPKIEPKDYARKLEKALEEGKDIPKPIDM